MGNKSDFFFDRAITKIVGFVLMPLRILFKDKNSKYQYQRKFLADTELCYCHSGLDYKKCCKKLDKEKNRKAVQKIKRNIKSGKTIVKLEFINTRNYPAQRFKKGSINPLNAKGGYTITNVDNGYNGDSSDGD